MKEERIKLLKGQLNALLNSDFRDFDDLEDISGKIGVYSIWKNQEVIYIGKTLKQDLKTRIYSTLQDFRTHTLNHKLMIELLLSKYGAKLQQNALALKHGFGTEEKNEFIAKGIFTEQQFSDLKKELKNDMKSHLKIKCISLTKEKDITLLEHFAIAILDPKYND